MSESSKPEKILGIDLGIGSCGWSLINKAAQEITDCGVLLWQPPQTGTAKQSTAKTRRMARSARRTHRRKRIRLTNCLALLKAEGLIPQDATKEWLHAIKGDVTPLTLRKFGLDNLLTDRQWAQLLYSLCKHRGYIAHCSGSDDSDVTEHKKVLKSIEAKKTELENSDYRTIGELLYAQGRYRNKAGDYSCSVEFEQIIDEINYLFKAQKELGNPHTSDNFKNEYLACISYLKDTTDFDLKNYDRVGFCEYYPSEKRAARSTLSFELCVAYERLGTTMLVKPDGDDLHLPYQIRKNAIQTWFSPKEIKDGKECKIKYSDLRNQLKDLYNKETDLNFNKWLGDTDLINISFKNVERKDEPRKEVFTPKCWRDQKLHLPQDLLNKMHDNIELADKIDSSLTFASSITSLQKRLDDIEDISDTDIDALCKLNFTGKIYKCGYGERGLTALRKLNQAFGGMNDPALDVVTLPRAEKITGLKTIRLNKKFTDKKYLPPYSTFDPTCTNPVVLRTMSNFRKLVNAVIKEYDTLDEIHIELARELKFSRKEIAKQNAKSKARKRTEDKTRKIIAKILDRDENEVTKKQVKKYLLWKEQGEIDLYTNQKIKFDALFADPKKESGEQDKLKKEFKYKYTEIDHIIPESRCCDSSWRNEVLTFRFINQNKNQCIPYEYLKPKGVWDEFKLRIENLEDYPFQKTNRLLLESFTEKDTEDFISRNLNDTRQICCAAKRYVEQCLDIPKNKVIVLSAPTVSFVRYRWGLAKDRSADNLHHVTDACVIAASDLSAVCKVARLMRKKSDVPREKRKELFEQEQPWPTFAKEVRAWLKNIAPVYAKDHKVAGRFFEDTIYHYDKPTKQNPLGVLTSARFDPKKNKTNYIIRSDGAAQLLGDQAFLRLWWDQKGKGKTGCYRAEVVYCADIPSIKNGTYIPRFVPRSSETKLREDWDVIPPDILKQKPIILFKNDAIRIKGDKDEIKRYYDFDISNNSWELLDPKTCKKATKGFTFASFAEKDKFSVVDEDYLGHVFQNL